MIESKSQNKSGFRPEQLQDGVAILQASWSRFQEKHQKFKISVRWSSKGLPDVQECGCVNIHDERMGAYLS